jgi:hypothetical protein
MKVGEFQQAVNTNSTSYGRFMKQSGPDAGTGSNIYQEAWAFFKKRELAGTAMPKKKVKKAQETSKYDVETVILDNEATDEVKVYDTCDNRAFARGERDAGRFFEGLRKVFQDKGAKDSRKAVG